MSKTISSSLRLTIGASDDNGELVGAIVLCTEADEQKKWPGGSQRTVWECVKIASVDAFKGSVSIFDVRRGSWSSQHEIGTNYLQYQMINTTQEKRDALVEFCLKADVPDIKDVVDFIRKM